MELIDGVITLRAFELPSEQLQAGFPAFMFSFSREEMHRAIFKCATMYAETHADDGKQANRTKKRK